MRAPEEISVRDARPDELGEVALLLKEAYEQYAPLMPSDAWQSYLDDIMDVGGRMTDSEQIVAELERRLAGSVTLYLTGSQSVWPAGWAGVRLLGVRPAFRGRGVGRALMAECVRRCRAADITTLGLHTTTAMHAARRLYEAMGFVRVPELDFHPDAGVVVMAYYLKIAV